MRFETVFAHREDGSWQYPRHPVVCMLDIAGLLVTLTLLAVYPQKFVVAALPIAIVCLYTVSLVYHWLPQDSVLQRLDHLMIAVVIGATYLPFWGGNLLPEPVATPRLAILTVLFAGTCVTKSLFFSWHKVGGIWFLALGLYGTVVSFNEIPLWVTYKGAFFFQLGSALYLVQFLVYVLRTPNPLPERFGYRETQHALLLVATTLHSTIVLTHL